MDHECDCIGPFRRNPECRAHDVPDRIPELVSWRYTDTSQLAVVVCWEDSEGERRITTLDVEHDVDGASFHYRQGDKLEPDAPEDMLWTLEGDMSALEGSRYIPIRPYYYRPVSR